MIGSTGFITPDDIRCHPERWELITRPHDPKIHSPHFKVAVIFDYQGQQEQAAMATAEWFRMNLHNHFASETFYVLKPQLCTAEPPADKDAKLLSQLIAAECTNPRWHKEIDVNASLNEMAAIGYSAVNRRDYLINHSETHLAFFGAAARTLAGVIVKSQYGSVGSDMWKQALSHGKLDVNTPDGSEWCDIWTDIYYVAAGVLSGEVSDPFGSLCNPLTSEVGTYGMRTADSAHLGKPFFIFPTQIKGSNNVFYGLSKEKK